MLSLSVEEALQHYAEFGAPTVAALRALAVEQTLSRTEHVLRAGDMATRVGIVLEGLLREYFVMADGSECTKAFVVPLHPTGSLADLISGEASRAFIVAEEPARVLWFEYSRFRALVEQSLELKNSYLRDLERLLLQKAEREYELLGLPASERYERFQRRFPGLEARVAARHVASYLGVTPVYLSRLRRRRRQARAKLEPRPGAQSRDNSR